MKLFSSKNRSNTSLKQNNQTNYDYYNDSARPQAGKIRDFLEYWFNRYPTEEQNELKARIISSDSNQYSSAIFELILYAICSNLGFTIQIHPEIPTKSSSPDFLLRDPKGNEIYLEAAYTSGLSEDDCASKAREKNFFNTIDKKLKNKFFKIAVNTKGKCRKTPSGNKCIIELKSWLSSLEKEFNPQNNPAINSIPLPPLHWEDDGWKVTFIAYPKRKVDNEKSEGIIFSKMSDLKESKTRKSMYDTIVSKGHKYGVLNKPFLVALNVDSMFLDRRCEMEAIFGKPAYRYQRKNNFQNPEMCFCSNGAWYGQNGIQYTRISGVWFFKSMSPYEIIHNINTLYLNPWAEYSLDGNFLSLPHALLEDNKMIWKEGKTIGNILGLDQRWPK